MIKLREFTNSSHTWLCVDLMTPYDDDDDDDGDTNLLHLAIGKYGWFFDVPRFIKPKEQWVHSPSGGYVNSIRRAYGVSFVDDAIHICYGIQPGTWIKDDPANSDHVKLINYPWNFEHVRHDAYFANGERACCGDYFREWTYHQAVPYYNKDTRDVDFQTIQWFTLPKVDKPKTRPFETNGDNFSDVSVDTPVFKFFQYTDFDGMKTVARVNIEEREWVRGKWPWLRAVLKHVPGCRMVGRCIEIEFRDPVGARKNTWKGGTVGMSYCMLEGQTIDEAWQNFVASSVRP